MVATLLQDAGWEPAGHTGALDWLETLGGAGALALALVFVALVVKAFVRRGRYRAVEALGPGCVEALREAVAAAERRTVGEIVPVVLERSDRHPAADWIAGALTLSVGSVCLAGELPWDAPPLFLLCQAALFAVGFAASRALPDFRRNFISARRATEMAREQALQEFFDLGLHETEARTGVLLFVSLLEHRVVVLGDRGIDAVVDAEVWLATDRAILDGIRAGSLKQGLLAGIERCADVLAEHFPWAEGDRNEVPDRVVVRAE